MAASVVQAITGGYIQWNNYVPSTQPLTFGSPVTAGNSVIILCSGYHPNFTHSAPTDTAGNTYAIPQDAISGQADSGSPLFAAQAFIYAAHNVTGGFTTVTQNGLVGGIYGQITAIEVSGLDGSPNDRAAAANLLGPSSTDGNVSIGTLAQAEEFVAAVLANTDAVSNVNISGPTGGGTYTNLYREQNGAAVSAGSADHTVTAATTAFTVQYSHDDLTGSDWAIAAATFKVAVAGAPVFDSAPAIQSETTSAYTVAYDGGSLADNIYAGAWSTVATPPTAAQVEAGTGARGTATEAVTGSPDTLAITPTDSPVFPIYKLYFALKEGAANFSGVASLTALLDPPIGYQHVMFSGTPSGFLVGSGISAGSVIQARTTVSPGGYLLTVNPNGSFSYPAIGDGTRQSFLVWYYDAASEGWADPAPVTVYVNNVAPILAIGTRLPVEISALEDVAISPVNVASRGQDQEGDTLTATTQTGTLPTGLTLSTPNVTGTPTTVGITRTVQRLTDVAGDFLDIPFAWIIRPVRPAFVGSVSDVDVSTPTFPTRDYSSEFTHDLGESEPLTFTLKQVGAGVAASQTSGSASLGRAMTLVSAGDYSAGDYVSTVTDTEPNLVLAKYGNTLELNRSSNWGDNEPAKRHPATTFAPAWLSLSSGGELTGSTGAGNEALNLAIRATDGDGEIDDSPLFDVVISNQPPYWGGGLNKVFRFVVTPGTDTIDFTSLWTDPENNSIVEYLLDFSESGTDSALPAGWSFNTSTGVMTVNTATAGVHTDWIMTAEDASGAIGTSATFDILIVAVQVVTFRFEKS